MNIDEKRLDIWFSSNDINYLLQLIDEGKDYRGLFGHIVEEYQLKIADEAHQKLTGGA